MMMDFDFPTKTYESFLHRIGLLGDATISLALFYSMILSLQLDIKRAKNVWWAEESGRGRRLKEKFGLDIEQRRDLCNIVLAGELDIISNDAEYVRETGASLQKKLREIGSATG